MKKRSVLLGAAAAVMLMTAGCQSKYEKVDVPGTAAETVAQVRTDAAAQAGTDATGQDAPDQTAGISEKKAERTTESAPTMETRDEIVYVKATTLNLRVSPAPGTEVIAALANGTALKRTGDNGTWSRVEYEGKTCYAASGYLTTEKPAETAAASGQNAEAGSSASASQSAGEVGLNMDWKYASMSKINSGKAVLYRSESSARKNKVVCVNAGHGTKGGSSVKTSATGRNSEGDQRNHQRRCHHSGSCIRRHDLCGRNPEAKVTLSMARVLKDKLLARGYDVLMIRESDDVQLDNVARTVLANNLADCHIALHWDSTKSNKGAFYMSVPNVASYRAMEPVASHWQQHNALGESLVAGLKNAGVKIFSGGSMEMDLTQTSYSTIPSIDIELGDGASDHSASTLDQLGTGLADGVDAYFGK